MTLDQAVILFEDYNEYYYNRMIFEGNLAGIDLRKEVAKADKEGEPIFKFKAPEEYEKLSEEERKEITERMLNFHKTKLG